MFGEKRVEEEQDQDYGHMLEEEEDSQIGSCILPITYAQHDDGAVDWPRWIFLNATINANEPKKSTSIEPKLNCKHICDLTNGDWDRLIQAVPETLGARLEFAGTVVCYNLIPRGRDDFLLEGPVLEFWESGLSSYALGRCVDMLEALSLRLDNLRDWAVWFGYLHIFAAGVHHLSFRNIDSLFSVHSHTLLKRSMLRLGPDDFVEACLFIFHKQDEHYRAFRHRFTDDLIRDDMFYVDLLTTMPLKKGQTVMLERRMSSWSFEVLTSIDITRRRHEKVRACLAPFITDAVCCHILLPYMSCANNISWTRLTNDERRVLVPYISHKNNASWTRLTDDE